MFELNNLYNMDCMQGMNEIPDDYFEYYLGSAGLIIWDKVNGKSSYSDCEIAYEPIKYVL